MKIDGIPKDSKLCRIPTVFYHTLKKNGSNKSKLLLDLHLFIKPWKIVSKSIGKIIHNLHKGYSNLICTKNSIYDVHRREYEFSCSNSPAYPSHLFKSKRKNHRRSRYRKEDIDSVQMMFDMFNKYDDVVFEASTLTSPLANSLPGFGNSPLVRQLRVTDSPFSLKDAEENPQVDIDAEEFINKFYNLQGSQPFRVRDSPVPMKEEAEENPQVDIDAEEFIKKFYKDLNKQGRFAAFEPPSPHNTWER